MSKVDDDLQRQPKTSSPSSWGGERDVTGVRAMVRDAVVLRGTGAASCLLIVQAATRYFLYVDD